MKTIISISGLFLLLSLVSCENEIDRTIFIPDEEDINLPAYTEWGYNSFGAIYERQYFLASENYVPCKIVYKDGFLNFSLTGYVAGGVMYDYYQAGKMGMIISFPFSKVIDYKGLLALDQQEIDLSTPNVHLSVTLGEGSGVAMEIISGELYFKRAQLLRIDEQENRVILSGTFNIRFLRNGLPEIISDGRFDVGINKDFYSFE